MDDRLVGGIADLFALLGDPTRVRLLYALLDRGEQRVGVLADGIGVSESAVSHALRLLRTSKVVATRRDGRTILYRLDDPHVQQLLRVTREHLAEELGGGAPSHAAAAPSHRSGAARPADGEHADRT